MLFYDLDKFVKNHELNSGSNAVTVFSSTEINCNTVAAPVDQDGRRDEKKFIRRKDER